jgi:uncharacterized RDD family membrane protein YckC
MIAKRLVAFLIDYLLIITYALLLFGLVVSIYGFDNLQNTQLNAVQQYFTGFFTLTMPVFCYAYFMESGRYKATLGKQCMKIHIASPLGNRAILVRNILKFLPWEVAHIGIYSLRFYINKGAETPVWVWMLLVLPQVVVVVYFVSLFYYRGFYSLYDKFLKIKITFKSLL